MIQLLNFPYEILISILSHLELADLASVSRANKFLNRHVHTDQILQYHFRSQAAMVETNPHIKQVTAERLAAIDARESGWSKLTFDFCKRVQVQHTPSGIYDMTGGVYLLGDQSRRTLHYCNLPSKPTDKISWKRITIDKTLVDVGLSIYEHDLVAVVTTTPHHTSHGFHTIEVMLLQFSTGKPHPLARHPTLFVTEARWPRPSIGIEIVGDHLALILNHFLNPFQPQDRFYVFDWKTGTVKMEILAGHHTYSGMVFLSPTLLLLPNTRHTTLDIWQIPPTPTQTTDTSSSSLRSPSSSSSSSSSATSSSSSASTSNTSGRLNNAQTPILCLGLPLTSPGQLIITFSCRGEPNPSSGGTPYSLQPFHSTSSDAIVIFNIRVQHLGLGRSNTFSMFVHRSSLLALCHSAHLQSSNEQNGGPGIKRKANPAGENLFEWQNWLIGEPADEGEPADNAQFYMPWESWGPPVTRWFDAADMPTRWITTSAGQRCVLSAEPRRRADDDDDDDDDDDVVVDVPLKVLDFNPLTVKRALLERGMGIKNEMEGRLEVVTSTSSVDKGAFEEPIESSLPYISLSCPQNGRPYEFEGVLMDEERLLGLRTNNDDAIVEIDIMHVGVGTGDYV